MVPQIARKNPYIYGPPVGNSSAFVEREDIFLFVVHALQDEKQDAICLYGQRRIGKTSVLQYLKACLPEEMPCETVLFDLQGKANLSLSRILTELAQAITNELNVFYLNSNATIEESFSNEFLPSVLSTLPTDEPLVLMFDEFDTLTDVSSDQTEPSFFLYLRNLLTRFPEKLKFIFVLGRHISDLTTISLILLKNKKFKHVSLLPKPSAVNLIRLAEKNQTLRWEPEAVERVWNLSHGHSLFTQALCSEVWVQAYLEEPEDIPSICAEDVNNVIEDVLGSCSNIMEWLWGALGQSEKIVAAAIAQTGKSKVSLTEIVELVQKSGVRILIRDLKDAPRMLQEWDLIGVDREGNYYYRVELIRIWVQSNWPLSRVQKIMDRNQPIVENLYFAAQGLIDENKISEAISTLRQSIELNPRHSQSCELLADIYLKEKQLWEARLLLEPVVNILPMIAIPRLIDIYLEQASYEKDEEEQLNLYAMVCDLDRGNQEAEGETKRIYERRGEIDLKQGNLGEALEEFLRSGNDQRIEQVSQLIKEQDQLEDMFREGLNAIQDKKYVKAWTIFTNIKIKNVNYEYKGQKVAALLEQSRLAARTTKEKRIEWLRQPKNILWIISLAIIFFGIIGVSRILLPNAQFQNLIVERAATTLTPQLPVTIGTPLPAAGSQITVNNASKVVQWARWNVSQTLGIGFSSDSDKLATGSFNSVVMIWNVPSGNLASVLAGHSNWVRTVAFTQKNEILASGADDGTIRLWNVSNGSLIKSLKGDAEIINSIAFSPNQYALASGTGNHTIEIWEVKTGKLLSTLKGHEGTVRSIAFTPNGNWLISGSDDRTVKMWAWQVGGRPIMNLAGHEDSVTSLAVSNDSALIASGSIDRTVRIWNVRDGKTNQILRSSESGIISVDFSKDNKLLATGTESGSIQLWNANKGIKLLTLTGHESSVRSLAFSPDGKFLASGGDDQLFLWAIPHQ